MATQEVLKPETRFSKKPDRGTQGSRAAERQVGTGARHTLYRPYFGAVITAGTAVLLYSAYETLLGRAELGWLAFALLVVLTTAFSMKMPKSEIRVSVPDVFIFSSILLYGPAIGALTASMEGLMGSLRARTKANRFRFAAFNMTAMSISAYGAGKVYEWIRSATGESLADGSGVQALTSSLIVLAFAYFTLNTGLLTLLISLDKRRHGWRVWVDCFSWLGVGYLVSGLMAGMVSISRVALSPISVALLLTVPLTTYLTYRHIIRAMRENVRLKETAVSA